MPTSHESGLQPHSQRAARRFRLERLVNAGPQIAWTLALALQLIVLAGFLTPLAPWVLDLALVASFAAAVTALVLHRLPPNRRHLLGRMDLHARLPDSVLSAGDWENAPADPWREGQRRATLKALEGIDWPTVWPVAWPRQAALPVLCVLILLGVAALVQNRAQSVRHAVQLAAAKENAPVTADRLRPLQDVFKDWDAAQKVAPSPELAELMKQIQPLRDRLASGQMNEKQLLLGLNAVQTQVQAMREKLEAQSIAPAAASLASALRNLDGLSGLAAALERRDFSSAAQEAAGAAERYAAGSAKMPEGANAQTAASQLSQAAQQSSQDAQASDSVRQMQASVNHHDGHQMNQSLGGLKNALARESARQSQCHGAGVQMAQLGACRDGLCNKPGGAAGMKLGPPQLSLAHSFQQQKGAGSNTDANRNGPATSLDAQTNKMNLTGTAGQGDSETHTESSNDPRNEQTASSIRASRLAAYQKMSEQAIEDESLPAADRQMIKRYFEDIRPQSTP